MQKIKTIDAMKERNNLNEDIYIKNPDKFIEDLRSVLIEKYLTSGIDSIDSKEIELLQAISLSKFKIDGALVDVLDIYASKNLEKMDELIAAIKNKE